MKRKVFIVLWLFIFYSRIYPQVSELDSLILKHMEEMHIPGLAASAIRDGEVVWQRTYGMANIERKIPVSEMTGFQIASVSKFFTTIALFQLYEKGLFKLDDDISRHLPFEVRNPNHPNTTITFGQLLRHRSSIKDNFEFFKHTWRHPKGDLSVEPLRIFIPSYLKKNGANYSADKNFYKYGPGEEYHYSNFGFALIGYLVESISKNPFNEYFKKNISDPLNLENTGWFVSEIDTNNLAYPYQYSKTRGYFSRGNNGYPDWPAGLLKICLKDFNKVLLTYLNNGFYNNTRLLDDPTIQRITPDQYALGFYTLVLGSYDDKIMYTHGGGDIGVRALLVFHMKTKSGVIMMANGEGRLRNIVRDIFSLVFNEN